MDDLINWLHAQLDEDERDATAATPGPWRWMHMPGKVKLALVGKDGAMVIPSARADVYPSKHDAAHIIASDPKAKLAEIAAKRAILVELTQGYMAQRGDDEAAFWHKQGHDYARFKVIRLLALPYAHRPGYREEWRP